MLRSPIHAEKEAILERLETAKHRNDVGEIRRRLSELQYVMGVEDDEPLEQAGRDWLNQSRVITCDVRPD